jgi:hypothetical protein
MKTFILFLLLGVCLVGCDGHGTARYKVVDSLGNEWHNVKVLNYGRGWGKFRLESGELLYLSGNFTFTFESYVESEHEYRK